MTHRARLVSSLVVAVLISAVVVTARHSRDARADSCLVAPIGDQGRTNILHWSGCTATPTIKDWIGLYPSTTAANSAFVAWRYTNSTRTSGAIGVIAPLDIAFQWEWRIFANDGFTLLGRAPVTAVRAQFASSFTSDVANAAPGSTIQLAWTGLTNPFPHDWIGIYNRCCPTDGTFVAWKYTDSNTPDGTMPVVLPGTDFVGRYYIRLFLNDSFRLVATATVDVA